MVSIACMSICSASAFDKIPFFTRAAKATWIASKAAIADAALYKSHSPRLDRSCYLFAVQVRRLHMNFYPQRGQRSYGNRWCDGRRDIAPSLLPVGADRHLPGGAVRRFDARPLRPVRPEKSSEFSERAMLTAAPYDGRWHHKFCDRIFMAHLRIAQSNRGSPAP